MPEDDENAEFFADEAAESGGYSSYQGCFELALSYIC